MFKLYNSTGQKCVRHPYKDALSFCKVCKRYYCAECLIEAGGHYYCGELECGGPREQLATKVAAETDASHAKIFCEDCIDATDQEMAASTFTLNGFGTIVYGSGRPCAKCGSVEASEWFCLLYIPVYRIARYRLRWITAKKYIGRRLRPADPFRNIESLKR